jgi:hypothetical protein
MRVMLLAGVALALSTTAFAQELSGTQIRQALVGKTMSGIENGESYSEYLSPDGGISGRSPSGARTPEDGLSRATKSAFFTRKARGAVENGTATR